jgi:excisionase family DNA binding protein
MPYPLQNYMEALDTKFETLATRYHRRWDRELKAQIKRAQDKTFAAAMYFSLLRMYEVLHLTNPYFLELNNTYIMSQKLGWKLEEFLKKARSIRDLHRQKLTEREQQSSIEAEAQMQAIKAEWEKNPSLWEEATAIEMEITTSSASNSYWFCLHYVTEPDDKSIIRIIIKITTVHRIITQLANEYGLNDDNILSMLQPETNLFTGLPNEMKHVPSPEKYDAEISPVLLPKPNEILSAQEAADFLHIAMPTLYEKTSKGLIPHSKPGGKLLFHRRDLEQWILEGRKHTQAEIEQLANAHWGKLKAKKANRNL